MDEGRPENSRMPPQRRKSSAARNGEQSGDSMIDERIIEAVSEACREIPWSFRIEGRMAKTRFGMTYRLLWSSVNGKHGGTIIATTHWPEYVEAVKYALAEMQRARAAWIPDKALTVALVRETFSPPKLPEPKRVVRRKPTRRATPVYREGESTSPIWGQILERERRRRA